MDRQGFTVKKFVWPMKNFKLAYSQWGVIEKF